MLLRSGLRIQTIGDSGGGRLVNDTENLETGNGTCILRGQTLGIVEVGRDAIP